MSLCVYSDFVCVQRFVALHAGHILAMCLLFGLIIRMADMQLLVWCVTVSHAAVPCDFQSQPLSSFRSISEFLLNIFYTNFVCYENVYTLTHSIPQHDAPGTVLISYGFTHLIAQSSTLLKQCGIILTEKGTKGNKRHKKSFVNYFKKPEKIF